MCVEESRSLGSRTLGRRLCAADARPVRRVKASSKELWKRCTLSIPILPTIVEMVIEGDVVIVRPKSLHEKIATKQPVDYCLNAVVIESMKSGRS